MRYGYWLPVFGGWLRNVEDEGMEASWNYVSRLARRSEEIGYDLTLIAELNLNVVSSWWADEAKKYGVEFEQHDDRYARTREWLEIVERIWQEDHFSYSGKYYHVDDAVLQPKPSTRPRPMIYAGGESEAAKDLISRSCDAYVMHGDEPARVRAKIADMSARRERLGLPPLKFGVAAYAIVRDKEVEAKRELERITNVKQFAAGYENYQQWLAGTKLDQQG